MSTDQSAPPLEAAEAALRAAEREQAFWAANEKRLTAAYPDQFVAVMDGRVAARGDSLPDLYARLRERGVDPHRVWIKFLSSDPNRYML